jgi:hypothetical protein
VKDFLGKELAVGDTVVYIKNCATGSSTIRKLMFKGVVVGFTPTLVKINNGDDVHKINPMDCVKVEFV